MMSVFEIGKTPLGNRRIPSPFSGTRVAAFVRNIPFLDCLSRASSTVSLMRLTASQLKMGTNTSSPAAYVDESAGLSGIARMGGAQPRKENHGHEHRTCSSRSNDNCIAATLVDTSQCQYLTAISVCAETDKLALLDLAGRFDALSFRLVRGQLNTL